MIAGEDVYKVVIAMLPLYTAIFLGYASVKWCKMFKPDQCDAINRFICYLVIPFFIFEFISSIDPYKMNLRFLAADVIAKSIAGAVLVLWANLNKKGSFDWSITTFSLSSLSNTLLFGVPLLEAMYGVEGKDLVIQSTILQFLIWFIILMILLELRLAKSVAYEYEKSTRTTTTAQVADIATRDIEDIPTMITAATVDGPSKPLAFWKVMKIVCFKLAKNPNVLSTVIGLIWALIAKRWHIGMPKIIEGSILIMSSGGVGLAMFSLGLFMALQEKVIACGVGVASYTMVMRFVIGPAIAAIGALATGLHGDVLRIVVIQAALPQSVGSFVYAQEYGLHAQVISTAILLGTVVALPLLIGYYAVLDIWH
ncbi:OLC1v1039220C1 [Oldenlandia corymbosa var. corymbosa]|uniref:Auxin efflux carrier component n=1 Tax=Oldenlandia corymbosa var. corymbosa TaxID=529605 RepID=A0AAV1D3U1_OLDCO|nr:OLC1v1039220C1 [Oldenlandia corymbosa var. corymbosa]